MPVRPVGVLCGWLWLSVALWMGCSPPTIDRVTVFPVQGELFVGGKPAAGAMLTLHPVENSSGSSLRSMAKCDEQGAFSLSTYVAGDGAPPGDFILTVYWPDAKRAVVDPDGESEQLPPNLLAARFANPAQSPVRVRVQSRPNILPRLDLNDKAIASGKPRVWETAL